MYSIKNCSSMEWIKRGRKNPFNFFSSSTSYADAHVVEKKGLRHDCSWRIWYCIFIVTSDWWLSENIVSPLVVSIYIYILSKHIYTYFVRDKDVEKKKKSPIFDLFWNDISIMVLVRYQVKWQRVIACDGDQITILFFLIFVCWFFVAILFDWTIRYRK